MNHNKADSLPVGDFGISTINTEKRTANNGFIYRMTYHVRHRKDNMMPKRETRTLGVFLWALLLCLSPSLAYAQTAQEIARKAFASTVLLVMEGSNGQPLSLGSGLFVREGEIASNLHVVEGAAKGYAKLVGQRAKYNIEGITAMDSKRDLVILKISDVGTPALPLGDSDAVQVGESVYAVGNPQGLEGTFSQGIVSSIRESWH